MRVLDLSIWRPGPYATQLLAELGAEVIKVEPPGRRPDAGLRRACSPGCTPTSARWCSTSRTTAGRARALDLAAGADVVVEGYRPGVADRSGVGYEQVRAVNPSVIYCSVSGLGQDGPLAAVPGHDLDYVAWSGMLAPDGGATRGPGGARWPTWPGAWPRPCAVCAALVSARRTGEGERIDVAMAGVLATWTGAVAALTRPSWPTECRGRTRRACPVTAPSPPPTAATWRWV